MEIFMARKTTTRKDLQNQLNKITDTVDIDVTNQMLELGGIEKFEITKKTLNNIAKWSLDGKSQFEIRQNLELSKQEWEYLLKVCPAILMVMQHSQAYADIVLAGTLYQTAIGGHKIKRKAPIKIKDYENGRVVGEHIEYAEWEEVQPANANLLKFLAEHKMSETFGEEKQDNSKEHRIVVDSMNEETLAIIEKLGQENEEESKDNN